MKIITNFILVLCLLALISCNKLLPVDYDKAGRDLIVMMNQDSSLTISDFKEYLNETPGMSAKDVFTIMKTDNSNNELIQLFELDMTKNLAKDLGVDINNLIRALKN